MKFFKVAHGAHEQTQIQYFARDIGRIYWLLG